MVAGLRGHRSGPLSHHPDDPASPADGAVPLPTPTVQCGQRATGVVCGLWNADVVGPSSRGEVAKAVIR